MLILLEIDNPKLTTAIFTANEIDVTNISWIELIMTGIRTRTLAITSQRR